jgi:hypothetical protein
MADTLVHELTIGLIVFLAVRVDSGYLTHKLVFVLGIRLEYARAFHTVFETYDVLAVGVAVDGLPYVVICT